MFKIKCQDKRDVFHGKFIWDNSQVVLLEYTSEGDYNIYDPETMTLIRGNIQYNTIMTGIGGFEEMGLEGYKWQIFDTKEEADEQKRKETDK